MPLDTDFIRFSREIKPTKQCKISQKNLRSDQRGGGGRTTAPLKYATEYGLVSVFISSLGGIISGGGYLQGGYVMYSVGDRPVRPAFESQTRLTSAVAENRLEMADC